MSSLPVRQYPDIEAPVVSIETSYRGASAEVIETKVTQVIEDVIAGIEGIEMLTSTSRDERSDIRVEFALDRDIDSAANDIRDRVARIVDQLPVEADPPEMIGQMQVLDVPDPEGARERLLAAREELLAEVAESGSDTHRSVLHTSRRGDRHIEAIAPAVAHPIKRVRFLALV